MTVGGIPREPTEAEQRGPGPARLYGRHAARHPGRRHRGLQDPGDPEAFRPRPARPPAGQAGQHRAGPHCGQDVP